jgi:hypothetical protein
MREVMGGIRLPEVYYSFEKNLSRYDGENQISRFLGQVLYKTIYPQQLANLVDVILLIMFAKGLRGIFSILI